MGRYRKKLFSFRGLDAELHQRDALLFLKGLPAESVDLVVTSPPYCMGMEYETSRSVSDFLTMHEKILPLVEAALTPGGSVCWQVGHHVQDGALVPLDALVYQVAATKTKLTLRNRVVWTFGHGAHSQKRFSGRHETLLWFTKGDPYTFNLDAVRVPQRYPGKRAYKGARKGEWSGNPLGKNPGDVWDIPNVKALHPEKTDHPCQFPIALAQRCIRSMTKAKGLVVDPFAGSGTTAVAALLNDRNFKGSELNPDYVEVFSKRLHEVLDGTVGVRPDAPPRVPLPTESVAIRPPHFVLEEVNE